MKPFNKYDSDAIGLDCYTKLRAALSSHAKVVKLPSRIDPARDCGDGVVALVPIEKGDLLTHYGGLVLSESQARALPQEQRTHVRKLVKGLVIDGTTHFRSGLNPGLGGAINEDRDDPNCDYRESTNRSGPTRIEVRATKRIAAGEELKVDYGRDYDDRLVQGRSRRGRPRKNLRGIARPGYHAKVKKSENRPRILPARLKY